MRIKQCILNPPNNLVINIGGWGSKMACKFIRARRTAGLPFARKIIKMFIRFLLSLYQKNPQITETNEYIPWMCSNAWLALELSPPPLYPDSSPATSAQPATSPPRSTLPPNLLLQSIQIYMTD
jgi:hypothetical protein